jgi:hypothetical protein
LVPHRSNAAIGRLGTEALWWSKRSVRHSILVALVNDNTKSNASKIKFPTVRLCEVNSSPAGPIVSSSVSLP